MMMHMCGGRVNPRANDGCETPELAVHTQRNLDESSAEEGEAYFKLQVDGLAKFAKRKLDSLRET